MKRINLETRTAVHTQVSLINKNKSIKNALLNIKKYITDELLN